MSETQTASLSIRVSQDGVDATAAALGRLRDSGKGAEDSFGSLALKIAGFTSLANLAVDAGRKVVTAIVDMAKESVVLAAGFEKSRITWGVLVGDMDKGAQVFEKLRGFANKTPLSFESVNQAATTIKGFGVATQDIIPTLSKLGDVAMGDNNKLQSLALVYGQVMAQGKAKTQDLYQFINAGVPIFNLLATSMNKSAGEIKNLAADGAVTFDEIQKAITLATTAGGQFYGMMDKTSETTAGKWSTAMDNWKTILADIGSNVLPLVNNALDAFNEKAEKAFAKQNIIKVLDGNKSGDIDTAVADAYNMVLEERVKLQGLYGDQLERQQNIVKRAELLYNSLGHKQLAESMKTHTGTLAIPPPTGATGKPYYNPLEEQHIANAGWGDVKAYQTPWAERLDPFSSDSRFGTGNGATSSYGQERLPFPEPDGHTLRALSDVKDLLDEIEAKEKILKDTTAKLNQGFKEIGTTAIVSSFQEIGKALAQGADGAGSFQAAMGDIAAAAASSMGQLMMNAGLTAMLTPATFPIGLALFLAGGGMAILGGYMGASSSSSNGTSTSADSLNALTEYYMQAEAFNSGSRKAAAGSGASVGYALGGIPGVPSFSAYRNQVVTSPHWFGFANGGVFGEAGPEAAVPLVRTRDGNLGVRTSGSGASVSVVVNNNASGTQATAEESTDADGQRIITVTVEKIIDAAVARGRFDKSMGGRYGASAKGRKVSG